MTTSAAPSHNAYTVEDRGEDQDPFWLKIGAAWPHKDGKGFNVTLSALPLDGRVVLRLPTDAEGEPPEPKETGKPQGKSRRS